MKRIIFILISTIFFHFLFPHPIIYTTFPYYLLCQAWKIGITFHADEKLELFTAFSCTDCSPYNYELTEFGRGNEA